MSDDKPHHSNGVCLHCGGMVGEDGFTADEIHDGESPEDSSQTPIGAAPELEAEKNAREFAKALKGSR